MTTHDQTLITEKIPEALIECGVCVFCREEGLLFNSVCQECQKKYEKQNQK
jgi:hypothetical protein